MRKTKRLLTLLICLALLLGLSGCGNSAPAAAPPTTEAPTEPPVSDRYTQAAQPLRDAQDLAIDLTTQKTITTGIETFKQKSDQELILTGIGTETFTAGMTEELEIGDLRDEFTEFYKDGVLYVNVYNTGRFQGDMTEEAFLNRFAPAALLDETLYGSISAEETDAGVTLKFSDPAGPESWALPAGAEFLSASGTAKISNTGSLTRTTYTIEYTQGNTTVSMEVSSKAELYDDAAPEAPPEPDLYKKIDSIEVPRLYDTAILYMYSAKTASSTINHATVSQAANYVLTEQTQMHYTGTGQDHMSEIQYTVTSMDSSLASDTFSQTEHYKDGVYTYTAEGTDSEPSSEITPEEMYQYLQGNYSNNIPALEYIISAKAEDIGGLLYLEMELDEKWGQATADDTAYHLFQDAEYLNKHSSAYQTTAGTYYMMLDSATGFPVAAGTSFSGVHTIEGSDYILSSEIAQSYRLANPNTYETLAEETAPEEQATPLLYHVTGSDGQEMYLMGTIHVGDKRTAFLPDEVYGALEASDALAVEADITSVAQEMESDPELAVQLAAAYVNADGSATKTLLDADIYNKAVKLLKAGGNYNSSIEYMKPYLWCSSIENFYLTLGQLSSEKGMDMRLLELAQEQNKQVLEVESVLEQLEMVMNFSTELQVLLLEEAVNHTAAEYCDEVQTLYELWCSGDETALREVLKEETSDLTDEERILYQEYLDAMIIRRNEGMLDVATSYLEGGDTVFYAVGLAHLLQENGLVDTLRDAGYTVEQVTYN